jgi:hypothetical protein
VTRGALSLLEDQDAIRGQGLGDRACGSAELLVGGEEGERPASGGAAQPDQAPLDRLLVALPIGGLGDVVDEVEQRGGLEVKGRSQRELFGLVGAQSAAQVVKLARRRERGRRHDDAVLLVPQVPLHRAP